MTQPGAIGSAMPADESSVMRRLADLERQVRELGPSIANSFNSTVSELENTIEGLVSFNSIGVSGGGYSTSTSFAATAGGSVVTPAGFTSATVMAIANAAATNTTAGADYLYVRASINGVGGGSGAQRVANGVAQQGMGSAIRTFGVTAGSVITCEVHVRTSSAWGATGSNGSNIDAIVLFRKS